VILTEVFGTLAELEDAGRYHIETCFVKSDDLAKRVLRVRSDHGREYGVRLPGGSPPLQNGSLLLVAPGELVALVAVPDTMLRVAPPTMDLMGSIAHFLGNLHKPVQVKGGVLTLLYDPVVEKVLERRGVPYEVVQACADEPFRYADLAEGR
jgi:urease accessory protein